MSEPKLSTIVDVARLAGVAVGTASNVLNGRRPVSAERRERVLQAAEKLGYMPNAVARSLRMRQSRLVALCLPHTQSAYFATLVEAFEAVGAGQGFDVLQVLTRQDAERELQRVQALVARRIDGLILVPSFHPERSLETLAATGISTVVVDRVVSDGRFDMVTLDNRRAMREAVAHLVAAGHRRLLFVVRSLEVVTTRHRIEGLHQALGEAVPDVEAEIIERGDDEPGFRRRLASILQKADAPSAVIAGNSAVAIWLLRALRLLDIACPAQVALMTFDDPEWADVCVPALTVVHHPIEEMARRAWEVLIRRIEGDAAAPQHLMLQPSLIVRDSTPRLRP